MFTKAEISKRIIRAKDALRKAGIGVDGKLTAGQNPRDRTNIQLNFTQCEIRCRNQTTEGN